jgi:rubrerythrin
MARPKLTPTHITKNCPTCKLDFKVDWLLRNRRVFCSKKCSNNNPINIKNKIENTEKTFIKKYGGYPMATNPETKMRLANTMMSKYGVEHFPQSELFNIQLKKTKLEKHGNENYQSWDKIKETLMSRYGVNNIANHAETLERRTKSHKISYFNKLIDTLKTNGIIPLFTIDDFIGHHWTNIYKFKCLKCGYVFESSLFQTPSSIYCEKCDPDKKKTMENDIFDFLTSLVPPLLITRHDRAVLNGKELDFYFPEKKIALEFNGLYWHSEISGKKNRRYHLNKTNGCLFHGIQLIHILENEWRDHKEIVQSDLRRMLKIPNSNTIDVSDCIVKEINNRDKNEFLVNNHLYGEDKSSVKLGLYHNNRLVSVMTFIRSRFNKKVEWEILRYCDLLNIVIRGNSAKVLFDYFVSKYKPSSVLGYSNKRFLDDNFHLTLGFKFDKIMPPDYHYISPDYKCIYNKMFFKGDTNLKEKLLTFNPELSEWENMKLNGYDKFWDNGKLVWIWRK